MFSTRILTATVGTLLVGGAALFSNVAAAGGNVGWSVSIGGPGFAVSAGQPAYFGPAAVAPRRPMPRPYYRTVVVPRPFHYRPHFAQLYAPAPVRYYTPAPVVVVPSFASGLTPYAY